MPGVKKEGIVSYFKVTMPVGDWISKKKWKNYW